MYGFLQYNPELANIFEGVKVDLQGITLLEQEGKDNLINFANTGLGEINYQGYLSEVTPAHLHTGNQVLLSYEVILAVKTI